MIERIFGVVKKRFKVLRELTDLPIEGQARLVPACLVIHNFIRIHDPDDLPEDNEDDDVARGGEQGEDVDEEAMLGTGITRAETRRADARRDRIAEAMWTDYCSDRRHRRRH